MEANLFRFQQATEDAWFFLFVDQQTNKEAMGFRGALVILYSIALWYAGKLLLAWEHPFALFWSFYMIYAAAAHCCIGVAMCLGFTQLAGKDSKTGSVAHWAKVISIE